MVSLSYSSNDNKIESSAVIFSCQFRVLGLSLNPESDIDLLQQESKILVYFKFLDVTSFTEEATASEGGLVFGRGKKVLFPAVLGESAPLEMVVEVDGRREGYCVVYLESPLQYLSDSESKTIECCYALFSGDEEEIKQIGDITMKIVMKRIGVCLPDTDDMEETNEDESKSLVTEKTEERDVFVFKTKQKNPKPGSVTLELKVPKGKPKPVIPPYHEDVAVQTDTKKGRGKEKKKKNK